MLDSTYFPGGKGSALEIADGVVSAIYAGEPRRVIWQPSHEKAAAASFAARSAARPRGSERDGAMRSNPLARLFNLQRGDGRRGALLFLYLFLIITCYQLGKTARDVAVPERLQGLEAPLCRHGDRPVGGSGDRRLRDDRPPRRPARPARRLPAALRGRPVRVLVPGEVPAGADLAVPGVLHLGRDPRRAGADAGLDARELSPHALARPSASSASSARAASPAGSSRASSPRSSPRPRDWAPRACSW